MNVNFKERRDALDNPHSTVAVDDIPLIWHDAMNLRLDQAMVTLRRRQKRHAKARQPLRWRDAMLLAPVAGWAIIFGYPSVADAAMNFVAGVLVIFTTLLLASTLWPGITGWHFRRLGRQLREGKFGEAVMFSSGRAWLELNTALQAHGLLLPAALNARGAAVHAVSYLEQTAKQRKLLRGYDNGEGLLNGAAEAALGSLRLRAKEAAGRIASRQI
jgi:hypothetical protein